MARYVSVSGLIIHGAEDAGEQSRLWDALFPISTFASWWFLYFC